MNPTDITPNELNTIVDLWKWVAGILGSGLLGAGALIRHLWVRSEDSLKGSILKLETSRNEWKSKYDGSQIEIKELNTEIKSSIIPLLTLNEATLNDIKNKLQ